MVQRYNKLVDGSQLCTKYLLKISVKIFGNSHYILYMRDNLTSIIIEAYIDFIQFVTSGFTPFVAQADFVTSKIINPR